MTGEVSGWQVAAKEYPHIFATAGLHGKCLGTAVNNADTGC